MNISVPRRRPRSGRAATVGLAAMTMAVSSVLVASAATPPPAHNNHTVGLKQVGPIDDANGFPLWYKDTNNVRLELCTDPNDANCIMGDLPHPGQPVSFPTNFPDEAFWSSAESSIDAGGGESALLVTAVEAAFASADGLPARGQQISFGRMRFRAGGLVDGATYTVTHPYGVDTFDAEPGAVKGINTTEDIGSLVPDGVFDQTLGSRPAPFLRWNATAPAAPAGYLGDPTVEHAVTGSPYNTNFFRIEGPAGSFTGSTQLCADPSLGDSPTATDDCIQSNDFLVQGKIATRAGVQVTKAYYANSGAGHMMDLFAFSEPGQNLVVTGTGVPQTKMRDDGKGRYYARVYADGAPPTDLAVTNRSDSPVTVDRIDQAVFGDKVHINQAVYSNDDRSLTVTAQSGDDAATLALDGYATATETVANGVHTFKVANVAVPPADVLVSSNKGGVASDDVVITGAEDPSAQVVAAITGDTKSIQVGQTLTLDGTSSTGTITGYSWSVDGTGAKLSAASGPGTTFSATAAGTYTVSLTVTGSGAGNTSTDRYTIVVSDAAAVPVANAGPDQTGVIPTSVVTLDGTASKFASAYTWTPPAGITLSNNTSANPTFTAPVSTTAKTYTFTLAITDVNGDSSRTDTVNVTVQPDTVGVDAASYKRGSLEWRVRGTAQYCSANNTISVYWNKPSTTAGAAPTPVLLGTVTPALDLGVCSYDFRLKNTATALRATTAGTVTVKSALGGEALNQAFQLL